MFPICKAHNNMLGKDQAGCIKSSWNKESYLSFENKRFQGWQKVNKGDEKMREKKREAKCNVTY